MEAERRSLSGDTVVERIFIRGTLVLTSPLCIGTGDHDSRIDAPVLRGVDGIPYIPGTSLAGALQACLRESFAPVDEHDAARFWGSSTDDGVQSAFIVGDATVLTGCLEWAVEERDGVSIDATTGTAIDGRKYNFDVVPAGNRFSWISEVVVRACDDPAMTECLSKTVLSSLESGLVPVGAHTTKGFGRLELRDATVCVFDMTQADGVEAYLRYCQDGNLDSGHPLTCEPLAPSDRDFTIEGDFRLTSSLMVRSYSTKPEDPDETHIKSGGQDVLPGTSLKGVLRHRAAMILAALGEQDPEQTEGFRSLFGYAETAHQATGKKVGSLRSRLFVDEAVITGAHSELQTRVQIDRFTGGVRKGAFLEAMPLWSNHGDERLHLCLRVHRCKGWEAGLLMLLLKDLWTSDLPVGGEHAVGRGGLTGLSAAIHQGTHSCEIKPDGDAVHVMPEGERGWLESLVSDLATAVSESKGGV